MSVVLKKRKILEENIGSTEAVDGNGLISGWKWCLREMQWLQKQRSCVGKRIWDPVHRKKNDLKNSDGLFIVIRFGSERIWMPSFACPYLFNKVKLQSNQLRVVRREGILPVWGEMRMGRLIWGGGERMGQLKLVGLLGNNEIWGQEIEGR